MGKGDKKSRKGKISSGSFGKLRRKKSRSLAKISVRVLDEHDATASKDKVRKKVGFPDGPSENAEKL